jgi:hypothetical protein
MSKPPGGIQTYVKPSFGFTRLLPATRSSTFGSNPAIFNRAVLACALSRNSRINPCNKSTRLESFTSSHDSSSADARSRTVLNTSSIPHPGCRITASKCFVNSPFRCRGLSSAVCPGAAANATYTPLPDIPANPPAPSRFQLRYGLLRHASNTWLAGSA